MPSCFNDRIGVMKKSTAIILVLILGVTSQVFAQEEYPFTGKAVAADVNVRAGQSKNFEKLAQLQQDEEVIVVGKNFSWYKILLPDHAQSYVFAKFVEPLGEDIGMITATNLNIRARGDVQSSVVGRLSNGAMVRILEQEGDWIRIEPVDQSFGWVREDFIAFSSGRVPPPRVVTPPARTAHKPKSLFKQKAASAPAPTPRPMVKEAPAPPTVSPAKVVTATGVIAGLGSESVTSNIRHKLVVDGKPAYFLKGYRKIMDGFLNYKVNIEGEILPDIQADYPVVLVTKIQLIL